MYQPGDMIIYNTEGVCRVESIGPSTIPGSNPDKMYYTLKPLYRDGSVFIPKDTTVFISWPLLWIFQKIRFVIILYMYWSASISPLPYK